ncbi:MAG: hypothetical protein ACXWLD_05885 [Rhizomicrobium sp.]
MTALRQAFGALKKFGTLRYRRRQLPVRRYAAVLGHELLKPKTLTKMTTVQTRGRADPDAQVSIGYVCNQMGPDLVSDPRTMGSCEAVLERAAKL